MKIPTVMPPKGTRILHQLGCQGSDESRSLLPFLYHTRTLFWQPAVTTASKATGRKGASYRNFSFTPLKNNTELRHWSPQGGSANRIPSRVSDSEQDLVSGSSLVDGKSLHRTQRSRPSTITPEEKAAFDRIFEDISQSSPDEPDFEALLEESYGVESSPYDDLNTIFDMVINEVRRQEEQQSEAASRNYNVHPWKRAIDTVPDQDVYFSRTFVRPLRLSNGIVLGEGLKTEESSKALEEICDNHKYRVLKMLYGATSDVEIWKVLEDEVFSLVVALNAHIKIKESPMKAKTKGEKKPKSKGSEGKSLEAAKEKGLTNTAIKSTAIPINGLVSILQNNYAGYLVYALRLLRHHYPTSFYSLQLLHTIKRHGPISHVLGATTSLYNEIIFLKWTQFGDLHGMADLMQEMVDQGIGMNRVTRVLIKELAWKRKHARAGKIGPLLKNWWRMRSTEEAWLRVFRVYKMIKAEPFQLPGADATHGIGTEGMFEEDDRMARFG